MTVRAILDSKGHHILSVEPDAKLSAAVKLLGERKIGAVLVMNQGRLEGILSERDIVRVLGERGAKVLDEPVSAVMTRKVVSCRESDTVSGIMEMMTLGKFRHLPVVEDGKVVGLISIGDIVKRRVHEYESRAGSAARLHQDRLSAILSLVRPFRRRAAVLAAGGARMWIASWMESIARSAARAPWAIRSSAR